MGQAGGPGVVSAVELRAVGQALETPSLQSGCVALGHLVPLGTTAIAAIARARVDEHERPHVVWMGQRTPSDRYPPSE